MESDGKDKLIQKYKERAASLKMLEGIQKVFEEELAKLQRLEPAASEANVTRNYLDWLTQVYFFSGAFFLYLSDVSFLFFFH